MITIFKTKNKYLYQLVISTIIIAYYWVYSIFLDMGRVHNQQEISCVLDKQFLYFSEDRISHTFLCLFTIQRVAETYMHIQYSNEFSPFCKREKWHLLSSQTDISLYIWTNFNSLINILKFSILRVFCRIQMWNVSKKYLDISIRTKFIFSYLTI